MNNRAGNTIALGIVLVIGSIALLSDPKCKCGCRTLAEHLLKTGFDLLSGQAS